MGPVGELGDCVGGEEADNRDKWQFGDLKWPM